MNGVLSEKGTRLKDPKTACFDEREVIRTRRSKPPPNRVARPKKAAVRAQTRSWKCY
jgi:hypothetical protein